MKIIFAGTPDFAACALEALLGAGHEVCLVLTQPDRACGRGMKLTPSAVKTVALAHHIPVATPVTLNIAKGGALAEEAHSLIKAQGADVLIVAAYGLIIPQTILDMPAGIGQNRAIKAINIHASLLPRWRGAAPVARAIEAGDPQTGVTLMKMEAGLDTGPMIDTVFTDIEDQDTTASLTERLARIGSDLLVKNLERAPELTCTPQPEAGACYAAKLLKAEARVDWEASAGLICRRIRAFNPFPSCSSSVRGTAIKFWAAEPVRLERADAAPGTIISLEDGITIAAGIGALRILELQKPGKNRMNWKPFLQSFPLHIGETFK
ncbi:methionyl-tRNA formyltransferase [Mesosutterella sp. OilRF-GAM-744-9]|uniref:Methionyl-tRNA formyltransferase n=1 Tax=Mesosutterella porci TaxID=2915351 RepID=A0ABS9MS71_9BURK|nr:methionyl-tRNA formyltransferase [Mesosutterella sp. oilRF-744-WT-GAM-9]MCG5031174.1 methionyl-tRNA formyltransferase [Mesosutterella sp. oilRF-744-WT-GAM-9]MCI6531150.1 methionyl-tRNA formyltransferase [Mesosutterella sp.]